jgi:hypothetical protein
LYDIEWDGFVPYQSRRKIWRTIEVRNRIVTVNDRMQQGYRYALVSPIARDFDAEFRPELTPPDMLRLGVFGGNR